jgi:hypothetical protein
MTLILALGNSDQVIQVADRRLSWNGQLREDEASKAGLLECLNARLAFGFTGLAQWPGFDTRDWLLDALRDSGPPEYGAGEIDADQLRGERGCLVRLLPGRERIQQQFVYCLHGGA